MPNAKSLAAVICLSLLAVATASSAWAQRSADERSRTMVEALALYALSQDEGRTLPKKAICDSKKATLVLSEFWQAICTRPKLPEGGLGCLKGFFSCEMKEGMAGSKMPEGGSFDCENKLKSCQAAFRTKPPTK